MTEVTQFRSMSSDPRTSILPPCCKESGQIFLPSEVTLDLWLKPESEAPLRKPRGRALRTDGGRAQSPEVGRSGWVILRGRRVASPRPPSLSVLMPVRKLAEPLSVPKLSTDVKFGGRCHLSGSWQGSLFSELLLLGPPPSLGPDPQMSVHPVICSLAGPSAPCPQP